MDEQQPIIASDIETQQTPAVNQQSESTISGNPKTQEQAKYPGLKYIIIAVVSFFVIPIIGFAVSSLLLFIAHKVSKKAGYPDKAPLIASIVMFVGGLIVMWIFLAMASVPF